MTKQSLSMSCQLLNNAWGVNFLWLREPFKHDMSTSLDVLENPWHLSWWLGKTLAWCDVQRVSLIWFYYILDNIYKLRCKMYTFFKTSKEAR